MPSSVRLLVAALLATLIGACKHDDSPTPTPTEGPAPNAAESAEPASIPPAATEMKWPPPKPAGALYITHNFEPPVVISPDGKTGRLAGTGPVERVQVASNDVAFAGTTGASLRLYRLSGSISKALPAVGRDVARFAVDAPADRVVAAYSNLAGDKPYVAVLESGRWQVHLVEAPVGAVSAVAFDESGAIWVAGWTGAARFADAHWETLAFPSDVSCLRRCALAKAGKQMVLQVEGDGVRDYVREGARWVSYSDGGVEWSSEGWASNGVEIRGAAGTFLRLERDAQNETGVSTPFTFSLEKVIDGRGRVWTDANRGLAVVDGPSGKVTAYPQGTNKGPFDTQAARFAVVAGGPALPALPGVGRAKSVTAVLKVNGAVAKTVSVRICPVMPSDPGADDPCAHSEPQYDVTSDDKGILTWSDVVAGTYSLAFLAKTSQGKTQWAVVRGAFEVPAGGAVRLPPVDVRLSELSLPY